MSFIKPLVVLDENSEYLVLLLGIIVFPPKPYTLKKAHTFSHFLRSRLNTYLLYLRTVSNVYLPHDLCIVTRVIDTKKIQN